MFIMFVLVPINQRIPTNGPTYQWSDMSIPSHNYNHNPPTLSLTVSDHWCDRSSIGPVNTQVVSLNKSCTILMHW
jgi:hypothetical protein